MIAKQSILTSLIGIYLITTILAIMVCVGWATGHISTQQFPVAFGAMASVVALVVMARSYRRNIDIAYLTRSDADKAVNRNMAALKPLIYAGLTIMPISLFAGLWMMRNESPLLLFPAVVNLAITWWLVKLLKRAKCAADH